MEYALSQPGARDVVLIGHSMGGGIVVKFLYESPLAGSVTGVVIDSPVMDFEAPVDLGARERNLPGFVAATVKWTATLRFGVDWDAMDYLKDVDRLDAPILLIHGEDDTRVPIETSDKLAELRPDLVTYSVYPDTTHADAWNVDSERYERELSYAFGNVIQVYHGNALQAVGIGFTEVSQPVIVGPKDGRKKFAVRNGESEQPFRRKKYVACYTIPIQISHVGMGIVTSLRNEIKSSLHGHFAGIFEPLAR